MIIVLKIENSPNTLLSSFLDLSSLSLFDLSFPLFSQSFRAFFGVAALDMDDVWSWVKYFRYCCPAESHGFFYQLLIFSNLFIEHQVIWRFILFLVLVFVIQVAPIFFIQIWAPKCLHVLTLILQTFSFFSDSSHIHFKFGNQTSMMRKRQRTF